VTNTPDYLLTVEFFRDVRQCLRPGGTAVMNAFFDGTDEGPNRRLLATIAAAFPALFEFRSRAVGVEATVSNGFVVATAAARDPSLPPPLPAMPGSVIGPVQRTLASGRRVRPEDLARRARDGRGERVQRAERAGPTDDAGAPVAGHASACAPQLIPDSAAASSSCSGFSRQG
jgi:hypothetical protein